MPARRRSDSALSWDSNCPILSKIGWLAATRSRSIFSLMVPEKIASSRNIAITQASPSDSASRIAMRDESPDRLSRFGDGLLVGAGRPQRALREPVGLAQRAIEHQHGHGDHQRDRQPHPHRLDHVAGGVEGHAEHHREGEAAATARDGRPHFVGSRTARQRFAVHARNETQKALKHDLPDLRSSVRSQARRTFRCRVADAPPTTDSSSRD